MTRARTADFLLSNPVLLALLVLAVGAPIPAPAAASAGGQLDSAFSGDGKAMTPWPSAAGPVPSSGRDLVHQPDGKVLVVGSAGDDFVVARYRRDGSLDPTFSGDGRQTTDFGWGDTAEEIALQPDGKVVVAGRGGFKMAVARYRPDGSLDSSFSDDGMHMLPSDGTEAATALALDPTGRVILGGVGYRSYEDDWFRSDHWRVLARLTSDGSPDRTFSVTGEYRVGSPSGGYSYYESVAAGRDGKIVALGVRGREEDYCISSPRCESSFVERYGVDGSRDKTFSEDGGAQLGSYGRGRDRWGEYSREVTGEDLVLRHNGSVIVGGRGYKRRASPPVRAGDEYFFVGRLTPAGRLEPRFAGDGRKEIAFSGGSSAAFGLTAQPDGKIVLAGGWRKRAHPSLSARTSERFALARVNRDGSIDRTFSGDGRVLTGFPGGPAWAGDVVATPNGRLFAAGTARDMFAVAKYR